MAVKLETSIRRYIGLSTDEKPVIGYQVDGSTLAAVDLPAGSSFLESDTGLIYRWDGRAWAIPAIAGDEATRLLSLIAADLRRLVELKELDLETR